VVAADAPVVGLYVPAEAAVALEDPAMQKLPVGQVAAAVAPVGQ
jgi:hypothetical protein